MKPTLSDSLSENVQWIQQELGNSPDLTIRAVDSSAQRLSRAVVVSLQELADTRLVQEAVIAPLQGRPFAPGSGLGALAAQVFQTPNYRCETERPKILTALLHGHTIVLVDGHAEAVVLDTAGGTQRTPDEPPSEPAVMGSRDGFIEAIAVNRSLIRRRLPDPALRFERSIVGTTTATRVELAYLSGRAEEQLVAEARRRLAAIQIDGVLDSGMVAELIEDNSWSPFPQVHHSQRPDRVCADLLAGKVAILVDQSPSVLIAPMVFWDFLAARDDYYERWWAASLARAVRAMALFISFALPALWVSLTAYHQELFPTALAFSIAGARERIPIPAALEALALETTFELLREAGARLPRPWGQATSIVGGLVIGQAAVQAGLVSPAMVIVISTTGLASFTTPSFSGAYAFRIIRFGMLILAGALGLLGMGVGLSLTLLHLLQLQSFGVPYLTPVLPTRPKGLNDVLIRRSWKAVKGIGANWWRP